MSCVQPPNVLPAANSPLMPPPLLTEEELQQKLSALQAWRRSGNALVRPFKFKDFVEAVGFVNKIVPIAESMDHHPDILINYNRVTLTLSTHSAGGLTELDFALAEKINALA